jgi:hypothetical protein
MATEISVEGRSRKDTKTTVDMMAEAVANFDFRSCVVDHNLTDDQDNPLDFRSSVCVAKLDPRIGEEINTYIDKMNNFNPDEGDDVMGNSPSASNPTLS